MMKVHSVRRLAGLLMLLAGIQSAPLSAQPSPAIPAGAIRVPCCRCLDGTRQTINLNTRTAPWRVSRPGSSTNQPVVPAGNVSWAPVPPAGWVGPRGNPTTVGEYTYVLQLYVPHCTIRARVVMSGRFGADNSARLFLNSSQIAASQGTPNYGFLPASITPFTGVLIPGLNTISVIVRNSGGPTGMILQGQVAITCPREREQGTAAPGGAQ